VNPFVLALATQRLTQLVTEDSLTEPLRERIDDWASGAERFSLRDRVAVLSGCPACISVWAGGAVLLAQRTRLGRILVRILAASAAALLLDAGSRRLES
jgi:hypothetical protein